MRRALTKAAVQFAFGHAPGGPALYRRLTRDLLGTQAGYLTKMKTRWRPYAQRWRDAGLPASPRLWFHDAGWTPLMPLLTWLDFGTGAVLTDHHARMQAQHLAESVDVALALSDGPMERRDRVATLRWASIDEAIAAVDAELHPTCDARMPLGDDAVDLCHSGGALEHYRPAALEEFLRECFRALRPGGVASHVFDHRDHLFHTDKRWPFHAHWALPEPLYRVGFGHALGYHNRLPPSEVERLFLHVGFERVAVIRRFSDRTQGDVQLEAPPTGHAPIGLARGLTWRRWRSVSEADRCTWAAHYLFRKPSAE